MKTPDPPPRLLACFARSDREQLRLTQESYRGSPYLSLRIWWFDFDSGEWRPTRKGTSVRIAEAVGLADAILEAAARLECRDSARLRKARDEVMRHFL